MCLSLGFALIFSPVQARVFVGKASFYSSHHRTADGGHVGPLTAAHRSLPFGTRVKVTNLRNGRVVYVTINDRGPFVRGRVIDLSRGAARVLGMLHAGVARVRVQTM